MGHPLRLSLPLLLSMLAGCAISGGELPVGGGGGADTNVVSGIGVAAPLSALYAVDGDDVLVILVNHSDFCPLWQTKSAADDGDICVDSAGHPTTLFLGGLTTAGGSFEATGLIAPLVTNDGAGCAWEGEAQGGSVQLLGAPGSFTGSFELDYASGTIAGSFGDLVECEGIPEWLK